MRTRQMIVTAAGVVCVAAFATTTVAMRADTYPRQPGIRITNYTFDYTLSDASNEMVVKQGVDLTFVQPGVKTVELDLCKFSAQPRPAQMPNGFADPCAEPGGGGRGGAATAPTGGKGMTVTSVVAAGQALTWQHDNDRLRVTMPRGFSPGESFSFAIDFKGVPATGILIANNRHGDRGWVTNPWPNKARNFRAVFDHPSMKATHTTSVTAPGKYQVVSNGLLIEETDLPGGLRRTVWKEGVPISTWLMSLAVAPYSVQHFGSYRGASLSSWVFPQEQEAGHRAFTAHTQPVLEFFTDRIGPFPYEKLAQVQANGVGGGMELASSIFYGYGATGAGRQLIAHEMAHQYWGDAVTESDWDDVWLSEGFATYFALLYQEFEDGHDAFLEGVRRAKATALNYAIANPGSTIIHDDLADISRVIANGAQVYQGGSQVLHNIRGIVGTQTFWEGIRAYYAKYRDGTATTADFRRTMEDACRAAGDRCPADGRDLTWLFTQLLNRGGALQVTGTWTYDAAAKQVQVTLEQTQPAGLYRMPIEVRVSTTAPAPAGRAGGAPMPPQTNRTSHIVQLSQKSRTFSLPSDVEPLNVELDPDAWVFMRATFGKK
ncbi:MAG TPA: M1 family aminopeptidase [Vicinamibacterales bacterium]|nr:M1 family aminopeptidase [Vicinamibacterales bacterium]